MRNIPVNTAALSLVAVAVTESVDLDGKPKANQHGEKLWKVQVLATPDNGDKAELVEITVPGAKPDIQPLQPVEVEGLTARGWSMGDRSGISFSATSIRAAAPASNGRRVPAATATEA